MGTVVLCRISQAGWLCSLEKRNASANLNRAAGGEAKRTDEMNGLKKSGVTTGRH
jgi:hypothetical protein